MGTSATKHSKIIEVIFGLSYLSIWNLLDFPAGVVPVTRVTTGEDVYYSSHKDLNTIMAKNSVKGTVGLPAGVQVIGLPYKDELVLAGMKLIESQIQFYLTN